MEMVAAERNHLDTAKLVNYIAQAKKPLKTELCGILKWAYELSPKSERQYPACVAVLKWMDRLKIKPEYRVQFEIVTGWIDKVLDAIRKRAGAQVHAETIVRTHKDIYCLLMPVASIRAPIQADRKYETVPEHVRAVVNSCDTGEKMFSFALLELVANTVRDKIREHIDVFIKKPITEESLNESTFAFAAEVELLPNVRLLLLKRNILLDYGGSAVLPKPAGTIHQEVKARFVAAWKSVARAQGKIVKLWGEEHIGVEGCGNVDVNMCGPCNAGREEWNMVVGEKEPASAGAVMNLSEEVYTKMIGFDPEWGTDICILDSSAGQGSEARVCQAMKTHFASAEQATAPQNVIHALPAMCGTDCYQLASRAAHAKHSMGKIVDEEAPQLDTFKDDPLVSDIIDNSLQYFAREEQQEGGTATKLDVAPLKTYQYFLDDSVKQDALALVKAVEASSEQIAIKKAGPRKAAAKKKADKAMEEAMAMFTGGKALADCVRPVPATVALAPGRRCARHPDAVSTSFRSEPTQMQPSGGRQYLGQESDHSSGDIVVLDGKGQEVRVPAGQKKEFAVLPDAGGCLLWRPISLPPNSPAVAKQKPLPQGTNYVEVHNEYGETITFSCYTTAAHGISQATPRLGSAAGSVSAPPRPGAGAAAFQDPSATLAAVHGYLQQETPMRNACLAGGAAVVVYSFIQVISIYSILESKMRYVVSCYLLLFGMVTCLTELDVSSHSSMAERTKVWVHTWASGLEKIWGRGFFYLFQGSLMMATPESPGVGSLIGAYMCVLGVLCLQKWCRSDEFRPHLQEDYIHLPADPRMGMMGGDVRRGGPSQKARKYPGLLRASGSLLGTLGCLCDCSELSALSMGTFAAITHMGSERAAYPTLHPALGRMAARCGHARCSVTHCVAAFAWQSTAARIMLRCCSGELVRLRGTSAGRGQEVVRRDCDDLAQALVGEVTKVHWLKLLLILMPGLLPGSLKQRVENALRQLVLDSMGGGQSLGEGALVAVAVLTLVLLDPGEKLLVAPLDGGPLTHAPSCLAADGGEGTLGAERPHTRQRERDMKLKRYPHFLWPHCHVSKLAYAPSFAIDAPWKVKADVQTYKTGPVGAAATMAWRGMEGRLFAAWNGERGGFARIIGGVAISRHVQKIGQAPRHAGAAAASAGGAQPAAPDARRRLLDQDWEVWNLIRWDIIPNWPSRRYDLIHSNCIHFAEEMVELLGVDAVPAWVKGLHENAAALLRVPWPLSLMYGSGESGAGAGGGDGLPEGAAGSAGGGEARTSLRRAFSAASKVPEDARGAGSRRAPRGGPRSVAPRPASPTAATRTPTASPASTRTSPSSLRGRAGLARPAPACPLRLGVSGSPAQEPQGSLGHRPDCMASAYRCKSWTHRSAAGRTGAGRAAPPSLGAHRPPGAGLALGLLGPGLAPGLLCLLCHYR
ncbi:unnamed protein product [Prorocentrum cordatum]|uniref:PPPDE domain-containing protein n=1 Tax=Prorocentrum cordatum TaxID=2364126 RepID=A0ABN9QT60_9DINO|nr:unnamed protein product [Polarella glacialis]